MDRRPMLLAVTDPSMPLLVLAVSADFMARVDVGLAPPAALTIA